VALLVALPTIRVIFAKQKQKAPESVRTSGIALRRLWALWFYNGAARLWFHPIKSWSSRLKGKAPPQSGGANGSPKFDVDTRTRPSDLNTRLSYAAALLDCHIAVTDAPANRYVAVAVDAFFVTQWSHAVLPADPLRARWQRERRRTRDRDRDRENMSCSHPLASLVVALGKRETGEDVPEVPTRNVGDSR
jgi:hypothetical protein